MGEVWQWLPGDFEMMPPGPDLAALASVDRKALSDRDRVRLMQARNRLAHVQAELFTGPARPGRRPTADQPHSTS